MSRLARGWGRRGRAMAVLALVLAAGFRAAQAGEPAAAAQWFTPPRQGGSTASVDLTHQDDGLETIVVIGQRPSRSWRDQGDTARANAPGNGSRRWSSRSFAPPPSYCNSTLRTVGGQPASAADAVAGSGAGGC